MQGNEAYLAEWTTPKRPCPSCPLQTKKPKALRGNSSLRPLHDLERPIFPTRNVRYPSPAIAL
jgi:hypothetical protein